MQLMPSRRALGRVSTDFCFIDVEEYFSLVCPFIFQLSLSVIVCFFVLLTTIPVHCSWTRMKVYYLELWVIWFLVRIPKSNEIDAQVKILD